MPTIQHRLCWHPTLQAIQPGFQAHHTARPGAAHCRSLGDEVGAAVLHIQVVGVLPGASKAGREGGGRRVSVGQAERAPSRSTLFPNQPSSQRSSFPSAGPSAPLRGDLSTPAKPPLPASSPHVHGEDGGGAVHPGVLGVGGLGDLQMWAGADGQVSQAASKVRGQ